MLTRQSLAGCRQAVQQPAQRLAPVRAQEKTTLVTAATVAGLVANPTVLASLLVLKQVG